MDMQQAVEDFLRGADQGVHYPPAWFNRLSMDEACRLQLALLDAKLERGEEQVGWKVGLTAKAIQRQFNCHEPVFGYLRKSGQWRSGGSIRANDLLAPGFENEICFLMGADLRGEEVEIAEASAAVQAVLPALEVVENRGDLSAQIEVAVADNVQQAGFVTGAAVPWRSQWDLAEEQVEVWLNGELLDHGRGEAVLGNPLRSLVWLAHKLHRYGRGISAGQYVMAGSFTRQFPLQSGDRIETLFSRVGKVVLTAT